MRERGSPIWRWLAAVVVGHLAISFIHGAAHARADVPLSLGGTAFVFVVILAGPLVGLALTWPAERLGAWVIAVTMAGSLIFGLVNHFLLASPDHVARVIPQFRTLFAATAVLLAVTELAASTLAIRVLTARNQS